MQSDPFPFKLPRLLGPTVLLMALAGCGGGGGSNADGGGGGAVVTPPVVVTPPAPAAPYPAGLSNATLVVGSLTREYRVHVPTSVSTAPSAVVLVLHGGGGAGLDVANLGTHPLSVFRTVADREGFVVVYPGGMPAPDGSPGWNDCRSDNLVGSSADDLAFLDALIDRLRSQYALPASRVFMAGGSNGAQMTLAYAVTRASRVAAVASSGGSLPLNPKAGECSASPSRAMPILLAHGSADTQMPYAGGCVANLGGGCSRGRVVSALATRDRWLAVNGLAAVTPAQTVVDPDKGDAGPANRFQYAGAAPLEWWRLDGAGHTVPSRTVLVAPSDLTGVQSRDVEFAETAWAFFRATFATASTPPNGQALQSAREYNFASGGQTHLVMHEGQVIDEAYANGGAHDRVQLLASATKGFTGMVGAIAASEGLFGLASSAAHPAYGFYWWLKKPVPADLALVRNGPTGSNVFEDVAFLGRLLGTP